MTDPRELAERRLADARADAKQLADQNAQLNATLREARNQLLRFKQELDSLSDPPLTRGRLIAQAGDLFDVASQGRVLRVAAMPGSIDGVEPGELVLLNESLIITGPAPGTGATDLARVVEVHDAQLIVSFGTDEAVVQFAPTLGEVEAGDSVSVDRVANLALTVVARQHAEELVLGEVPDVSYDDIGGLGTQIDKIRDAVELPFLHRDRYTAYGLRPPKGVLLYGPPGCGKTMIAKAVATSLAEQLGAGQVSSFISIKGPELLNKFVGESERQIRLIFERAREQAVAGTPVIVFFDEMDSLFRTRGSGVSSDVESTIVPQLLAELDGVQSLENVIVIGASNREDMIDPAILRPGRLDVKIKLERPDRSEAAEILAKYLSIEVPLAPVDLAATGGDRQACVASLIAACVASIYDLSPQNEFLKVTYVSGDTEVLHYRDFASGAMLRNIVDRAKKHAIKDELTGGPGGVSSQGLIASCREEFVENEDLPNTSNPDDWARISGRKGERIAFVQSLISHQRVHADQGADA